MSIYIPKKPYILDHESSNGTSQWIKKKPCEITRFSQIHTRQKRKNK